MARRAAEEMATTPDQAQPNLLRPCDIFHGEKLRLPHCRLTPDTFDHILLALSGLSESLWKSWNFC